MERRQTVNWTPRLHPSSCPRHRGERESMCEAQRGESVARKMRAASISCAAAASPPHPTRERSERLAPGPVVPMELAARADGHPNGGLRAHGLYVMPAVLGAENEVARARVDGRQLVLDVPVDLALEHHPPLVVEVIVRVVWMPGGMAYDEVLDIVGHHQRFRPRRLALLLQELAHARLQLADLQQRNAVSHEWSPRGQAPRGRMTRSVLPGS